jgi:hypothetical protein
LLERKTTGSSGRKRRSERHSWRGRNNAGGTVPLAEKPQQIRRIRELDIKGVAVNDPTGHTCLLPFDTDDAEFVRGFEAGRVWALLRGVGDEVVETVHANNAEMMLRLGEATGRRVRAVDLDENWIEVSFAEVEGGLEF